MNNNETQQQQMNFAVVEPRSAAIPKPVEKKSYGSGKYVTYGEDNAYPDFLLLCYEECSTLQSIINGISDYVAGAGFLTGDAERIVNEKGETYLSLVQRAVVDYIIYGALSVGVRRDAGEHAIKFLDYHDTRNIRLDEEADTAFFCKDWTKSTRKVVKIPIFNPRNKAEDRSEMYVKAPASRSLYGRPMWGSAVKDVMTAMEISTFHLSAILNNFVPSGVVNFNNGQPDEDTQKKIEKRLNDKFSGAQNAARLLVCFNDSKDHATTMQRLAEDNFDQRYNALAKSVKENIFISFRAHPQLFGADPERQGFNSVEYEQTFKLFKETVVRPLQRQIEAAFATLGSEWEFTLAEFNINFGKEATE